jgi:hypothetical protein
MQRENKRCCRSDLGKMKERKYLVVHFYYYFAANEKTSKAVF